MCVFCIFNVTCLADYVRVAFCCVLMVFSLSAPMCPGPKYSGGGCLYAVAAAISVTVAVKSHTPPQIMNIDYHPTQH